MMSGTIQNDYLPNGTRVLNTTDGEPGTIVNGFAYDEALGGWYEYEVETAYGVERWQRREMVRMAEIEEAVASDEALAAGGLE